MRRNLGIAELGDLLERPILAVLATRRRDGDVLLSPVCHEWADGGFSFTVWKDDVKARHIARHPRVTLLVAEAEHPLRGIEVTGQARVDRAADAMALMARLGVRYGSDVGTDDFTQAYEAAAIEAVRLVPERVRAWDFADEY